MKPRRLPPRPSALAVLALLAPLLAGGQVRTDGTLGGAARTLAGPTYAIPESLGHRAGNNLFHSFQTFRIGSGETALFSTTTPTIANVIGRVTGGEMSTIEGTIRLQAAAGAPSLFLVNPAGVMFGPGATIDVPGAFHVSTADAVRFRDGAFHADPARASTFSSASPEAFGFLGEARSAVTLRGAGWVHRDAPLSLVAGDVALEQGASIATRAGDVSVVAVGRQAIDVPLPGPGAARLQGTVRVAGGADSGSAIFSEAGAGVPGGTVRVAAGRVELHGDNSGIASFTSDAAGGAVHVRADEALVITAGAGIRSHAYQLGAGGAVQVVAARVDIDGGPDAVETAISSGSGAKARGGNLSVDVRGELAVQRGGRIATYSEAFSRNERATAAARVGDVDVQAGSLRIEGDSFRTGIASQSGFPLDRGGDVTVRIAGDVQLLGGSIRAETGFEGETPTGSGNLRVTAGDLRLGQEAAIVNFAGGFEVRADELSLSGGSAITSFGMAPAVRVQGTLRVDSGSQIQLSGLAPGHVEARRILLDDGEIRTWRTNDAEGDRETPALTVVATESLELRQGGSLAIENESEWRAQGPLVVRAGRLLLDDSAIRSWGFEGPGGDLLLSVAGVAELRNGSSIGADNWLGDRSAPSRIVLRTGDLRVDDSWIVNTSENLAGVARTGDIDIDAREGITLRDARIYTSELSQAPDRRSGPIRLRAGGTVSLTDTGIDTSSQGQARAGDITVEAAQIRVGATAGLAASDADPPASWILSASDPAGTAGQVTLHATGAIGVEGRTEIGTRSGTGGGGVELRAASLSITGSEGRSARVYSESGSGRAGDLVAEVAGAIELRNGARLESVGDEGGGSGGAVRIRAGNLRLQRGSGASTGIDTSSYPGGQDAGRIDIDLAGDLEVRDGAWISSAANGFGGAGAIRVQARNVTVAGASAGAEPVHSTITTHALADASGELGGIAIVARERILVADGARITMMNIAQAAAPETVPRARLELAAARVELRGAGANLNTVSGGNVDAADVQVDASQAVVLQQGAIMTTADGVAGGGGNVRVTAPVLALDNGLIEANAYAAGASGGNIELRIAALLTGHGSLAVGGTDDTLFQPGVAGANVIQAVAPTGVSGNIQISAPQLDLASALMLVTAGPLRNESLGKSACQRTGGSSLGVAGRGGLPPSAADPAGSFAAWSSAAPRVASIVRLAAPIECPDS